MWSEAKLQHSQRPRGTGEAAQCAPGLRPGQTGHCVAVAFKLPVVCPPERGHTDQHTAEGHPFTIYPSAKHTVLDWILS